MKNLVFIALDANDFKKGIKKKYPGFNIQFISLEWNYRSIGDWVSEVKRSVKNEKVDILVGFSVGAIVALLVAEDIKAKKIDMISPSPFFKEVLNRYSKTLLNITGKRRIKDIKGLSIKDLKCFCKTNIYIGSEELEIMKYTANLIGEQLLTPVLILEGKDHKSILA